MSGNRVVARFRDGRTIKGTTRDFLPTRDYFHVQTPVGEMTNIRHADLKAVFFVRDLKGDPAHQESNQFEDGKAAPGRKMKVVFADGETLVGTTLGYQPDRIGFFLVPADPASNIERCFVVASATKEILPA